MQQGAYFAKVDKQGYFDAKGFRSSGIAPGAFARGYWTKRQGDLLTLHLDGHAVKRWDVSSGQAHHHATAEIQALIKGDR